MGFFLGYLLSWNWWPGAQRWNEEVILLHSPTLCPRANTYWQWEPDTCPRLYYKAAQNGCVVAKYHSISHISNHILYQVNRNWEEEWEGRKGKGECENQHVVRSQLFLSLALRSGHCTFPGGLEMLRLCESRQVRTPANQEMPWLLRGSGARHADQREGRPVPCSGEAGMELNNSSVCISCEGAATPRVRFGQQQVGPPQQSPPLLFPTCRSNWSWKNGSPTWGTRVLG